MQGWKKYDEEKPDRAGNYLVLYGPCGLREVCPDIASYYMVGDTLYSELGPESLGTPGERLTDSLLNRLVLAMKEGFYEVSSAGEQGCAHELNPVFWAELPPLPEGYTWY